MRRLSVFTLSVATGLVAACGGESLSEGARLSAPLVYGSDDRREVFEGSPLGVAVARSTAVFISHTDLEADAGLAAGVRTVGQEHGTCEDEHFNDQPSVAFCSAVLVERDLVLTAGHCLRLFALADFGVVFGYTITGPEGALSPLEIAHPVEIVEERFDGAGASPRLDYGWVRLDRRISSRFAPAPVRLTQPVVGEPLLVVSATEGAPLKVDEGGAVRRVDPVAADYFVADTDTFGGSSGAGAFDAEGILLGILAGGEADYETEPGADCAKPIELQEGAAAEEYSRVDAALGGLCARVPEATSLCRPHCGPRCEALEPATLADAHEASCAVRPLPRGGSGSWPALALSLVVAAATRRRLARRPR